MLIQALLDGARVSFTNDFEKYVKSLPKSDSSSDEDDRKEIGIVYVTKCIAI